MSQPELVDNLTDASRHRRALGWLVEHYDEPLSVATGYINLGGLNAMAELADGRPTRLMIGAEPEPNLGLGQSTIATFGAQIARLKEERDFSRFPPSRQGRELAKVALWLDRDEVEIRRYTDRFLHGKAYLLGGSDAGRAALVTSANLTGAGLTRNLELGMVHYQPAQSAAAIDWFDGLWEQAVDYKDALRELLFPSILFASPEEVYLRALLELMDPIEADPDRPTKPSLELAPFQREGYERAREIMRRHGGVIYADGVGTGKTEIGLSFIEETTQESGEHALVVTPPQLRKRWDDRIQQAKLTAKVITFQELASDEQLVDAPGPRTKRVLPVKKDAYRLVIVDEAHALRNDDTTWHRAMERLLGGSEKRVLLLTATPINNSLWDFFNLVMLFARHDLGLAGAGIDSIRDLFVRAGANSRDPEDLQPEVLFPLAEAVAVRRDRLFIERNYPKAQFPNGTPVRFPKPKMSTARYDLDRSHPGLVERITSGIEGLKMARYTPSLYLRDEGETGSREIQVAGLIQSAVLKRFESCWHACLVTVRRMIAAHDRFLEAWEAGVALTGKALLEAVRQELDGGELAGWIEGDLPDGAASVEAYRPELAEDVRADRERLARIEAELAGLDAAGDPKLAALRELLSASPSQKIAVFATFADTVRYLDENLPPDPGGRKRVTVIGSETNPDQRTALMSRFAPESIVARDYEPPQGEVDLLLATDVLAEGQNLQQAQAVISYDMPWNPQRVVQRNGRVIRLLSDHEEVYLTTMLPEPGELEAILGLEAKIQGKIKAAGVFGMESEVIAGQEHAETTAFAARLIEGDEELLAEQEVESGAFIGEQLRRMIERAADEGDVKRVLDMPWGIGASFRQTACGASKGAPGIFFAVRTPPMAGAEDGYRYWRFVESESGETTEIELDILRRIDPEGGEPCEPPTAEELEAAWELAAAEIVEEHNDRLDFRRADAERIGPRQRWAIDLLRDPAVTYPSEERGELAVKALRVARSSAVRRRLTEIERRTEDGSLSRDDAAQAVIELVESYGLRPVEALAQPATVEADQLGVVCWMAVRGLA